MFPGLPLLVAGWLILSPSRRPLHFFVEAYCFPAFLFFICCPIFDKTTISYATYRRIRVVNRCVSNVICHYHYNGVANDIKVYIYSICAWTDFFQISFFFIQSCVFFPDKIIPILANVFCTQHLPMYFSVEISLGEFLLPIRWNIRDGNVIPRCVASFDFTFCPFIVLHSTTPHIVCVCVSVYGFCANMGAMPSLCGRCACVPALAFVSYTSCLLSLDLFIRLLFESFNPVPSSRSVSYACACAHPFICARK